MIIDLKITRVNHHKSSICPYERPVIPLAIIPPLRCSGTQESIGALIVRLRVHYPCDP